MPDRKWQVDNFAELSSDTHDDLEDALHRVIAGAPFFKRDNPFVCHVVLRKRTTLEDEGLLQKIGVHTHPNSDLSRELQDFQVLFEGQALSINDDFREAYTEAKNFVKALGKRVQGGGFMKNLMEQRICSSIAAGLNTARMLLEGPTYMKRKMIARSILLSKAAKNVSFCKD